MKSVRDAGEARVNSILKFVDFMVTLSLAVVVAGIVTAILLGWAPSGVIG